MSGFKGLVHIKAKDRDYYYAWRKGPRVDGEYGSDEFHANFARLRQDRHKPDSSRLGGVVADYRASDAFTGLAASTRKQWRVWLDRIYGRFGELYIEAFDRGDKIKPVIRKWRNDYAATPRTADYGIQVLSRVLAHAVDPMGLLERNPCEGIKQLYSADRSEIIWTAPDLDAVKKHCSAEVTWAVDLAAHTGLRLSDLLRLSWSHIGEDAIALSTGKSRQTREAYIPLYDDLRALLTRIPKRATTVLTSSRGRPWTKDGFGTAFNRAKNAANIAERGLHFHDLRGTAATRFYIAGLSERVVAEILGWEEEHVRKIIRRYVGRQAATKAIIAEINRGGKRT